MMRKGGGYSWGVGLGSGVVGGVGCGGAMKGVCGVDVSRSYD